MLFGSSKIITLAILFSFVYIHSVKCDDFPSLLMANASIAVLLDREYLDTAYDDTLNEIKIVTERVLRENLKNGGLYVRYYSWTMIDFKKDFTSILSITNCKDTWKIFKKARAESILHIALTDPHCPRLPQFESVMIPIIQPGEELPQVLLDMKTTHEIKWKSAIVLHDDSFDRDMISRAVIALSTESPDGYVTSMSLSIFKLQTHILEWERRKNLRKTLLEIPTQYVGKNFIAIVTTNTMEHIMEAAKDLEMVNTFSKWLYIISDTNWFENNISSVKSLISEGDNIAFAYNLTYFGSSCTYGIKCHIGELLHAFVQGLSRMIKEEQSIYGQISDEEWEAIRPSKREKRDSMLKYMIEQLKVSSRCNNCTTWRVQAGEVWGNIYDSQFNVYSNENHDNLKKIESSLLQVGEWKPVNGFEMTDVLFPHAKHGFRQKILHIVTYHNPPWQIITYNESGVPGNFQGLTIDILNELSRKLNFTYKLHVVQPNNGNPMNETDNYLLPNNASSLYLATLNIPQDIINIVGSNKVLMAAVGVTVNERYKQILNFTMPISTQTYSFIVSRPKELSRIYLFLSPFAGSTWLCLAGAIVLMSPLLYIVHRLSPYYSYHGIKQTGGLNTVNNCFWYIYGALLQQGGLHLPKADSGRLIIGTWWLVVIIVVTTYCGNLVAYLTFPKIETPITNVNQILRRHKSITWGIKAGTYLEEYLKVTDLPKHRNLYEHAIVYESDSSEMINLIRQGKHIIFDWKQNLQFIMKREFLETNTCDFSIATDDFLDEQISILMPRNSPYLDLINREIKRMHQMGFIRKWLENYLPKKDRCTQYKMTNEITNHTVNIDDMQGCFLVLLLGTNQHWHSYVFLGIIGSIFLIIVEKLWSHHQIVREKKIIKPFTE